MNKKKHFFKASSVLLVFFLIGQIQAQISRTTDSLINILPTYDNYREKAEALFIISWSLQYTYPDSSLFYLNQVLDLGRANNNDTTISGAYNRMGIAYDIQNKWEESLEHYTLAIEYNKKTGDSITRASIYSNRGLVYWNKNLFEKALVEFINAQQIFEAIGHKKGIANCMHNTALIHMDLENEPQAIEQHKEALRIRTEIEDENGIIDSKTNLALLYYRTKDLHLLAKSYLKEAIEHYKKNEQYYALAKAFSHMAHLHDYQKNYDSSLYYFKESIEVADQIGAKNFKASSIYSMADIYSVQENYREQLKYLEEALEISKTTENLKLLGFIYDALGNCNYNLGNYKTSSQNFQDSRIFRDSVYNIEKAELIQTLELKFETAKKENQITQQKLEIADKDNAIKEQELEKSRIKNWIYILSALLLLILSIGILFYQRKKRRLILEKNEALIKEKEKGLEAVILSQDEERKRIAKNLHDSVIQQMVSLNFGLRQIKDDSKTDLLKILDQSTIELRDLSHKLMPKGLVKFGLEKAVEGLLELSLKFTKIDFHYEFSGIKNRIPQKIELNLYRVIQELTQNVVKHSGASKLDIQLYQLKNNLHLILEDNGKGFTTEKNMEGIGLQNIKSRVESMHGSLNYDSQLDRGTIVTIKIPLDQ